jgi:hypothetical protein
MGREFKANERELKEKQRNDTKLLGEKRRNSTLSATESADDNGSEGWRE